MSEGPTLEECLAELREYTLRVSEYHMILGAALVLLLRCASLSRNCQHRLLTAAAAMVEAVETCAGKKRGTTVARGGASLH